MLKKVLEVNFFIKNLLVPVGVLAFYCGSYAFFSSRFLPQGVNEYFASRIWIFILLLWLLMAGGYLVYLVKYNAIEDSRLAFKKSIEKIFAGDFLLLLLPLTPVLQYILNNQDILSPLDSLLVLIFFAFFSSFYIYAVPALLGTVSSTRILMSLGLAFVFTITSMASLSFNFSWYKFGSLRVQLIFLTCVFIACWFLLGLNNRKVLYLFVAVNFLVNSGVQLLSQDTGANGQSLANTENNLQSMVAERIPAVTPTIYLLIYDSYVINETMLAYGIDNSAQEDYLVEQGFVRYPHTYSVGSATLDTMSKVLNASFDYYGAVRRAVSGDGIVQNTFRDLGYQAYGVFPYDYMFRGIGSSYDFSIPQISTPPSVYLISAILIGEFAFDLGFDSQTYDQFLETKQSILEDIAGKQVFIYTHSTYPNHSQNSGVCLPDETELFYERLKIANKEMQQDVKTIIENDPEAIIIVAGDHGPYLTKNCTDTGNSYNVSEMSRLDIQDRFGSFLAIRWPTDEYTQYDDITVLQDVFPAIFAYLYKDPQFLTAKIDPVIENSSVISGITVKNGIIYGGINDGEPLFLSGR